MSLIKKILRQWKLQKLFLNEGETEEVKKESK